MSLKSPTEPLGASGHGVTQRPVVEKFGDTTALLLTDPELVQELKSDINSYWGLKETFQHFPGCQPVSLSREKLVQLAQSKKKDAKEKDEKKSSGEGKDDADSVYVTKKTDGIRYILALTSRNRYQDHFQIMINRKYEMRLVKFEVPLVLHDGTILDGELVQEPSASGTGVMRHVFYVFDVIAASGISTRYYPLTSRLLILQHLLQEFSTTDESPFVLRTKLFYPVRQIREFIAREQIEHLFDRQTVSQVEKPDVHKESPLPFDLTGTADKPHLQRRKHPCDGLIFIHNHRHVTVGADFELHKWKPLHTLDFFFRLRPADVSLTELFVMGNNEPVLFATHRTVDVMLPFADESLRHHGVKVFAGHPYELNNRIVECAFCAVSGIWKPMWLRSDKKFPNYVRVAEDTVRNVKENITLEELCDLLAV